MPRKSSNLQLHQVRAYLWVAGEADNKLNGVATVTYRVWDDFPDKQITTTDRADQFAVWLSVNGEFPILAYIQLENRKEVWQRRYLDLPGRPRDKQAVGAQDQKSHPKIQ